MKEKEGPLFNLTPVSNRDILPTVFRDLENTIDKMKPRDFDAHPLGLVQIDPRGAIQAWNRTLENWSGLKTFDVIGKKYYLHLVINSPGRIQDLFQKGLAQKKINEIFDFEFDFPAQKIHTLVYFFFRPQSHSFWLAIQKK